MPNDEPDESPLSIEQEELFVRVRDLIRSSHTADQLSAAMKCCEQERANLTQGQWIQLDQQRQGQAAMLAKPAKRGTK